MVLLRLTNGIRYAAYSAARATQNTSRRKRLCGVFLRHIFAVAGMLRIPLSQPQKRRIPRTLCASFAKTFLHSPNYF